MCSKLHIKIKIASARNANLFWKKTWGAFHAGRDENMYQPTEPASTLAYTCRPTRKSRSSAGGKEAWGSPCSALICLFFLQWSTWCSSVFFSHIWVLNGSQGQEGIWPLSALHSWTHLGIYPHFSLSRMGVVTTKPWHVDHPLTLKQHQCPHGKGHQFPRKPLQHVMLESFHQGQGYLYSLLCICKLKREVITLC